MKKNHKNLNIIQVYKSIRKEVPRPARIIESKKVYRRKHKTQKRENQMYE